MLELIHVPLPLQDADKRTHLSNLSGVKRIRRLLKLAATAFGVLLYVWYAAVRLAPGVKRRKQARRA
jgi:hypothetical protein